MSTNWFFNELPPSRHSIENQVRLAFWQAGFGRIYFTCTKDEPPFELEGAWSEKIFSVEWQPKEYLLLKMKEPDEALLDAFQRALRHKPLAAYRNGGGNVVVEWRARDVDARYQELQASGVAQLQRLSK